MKLQLRRPLFVSAAFFIPASVALAHPGHEGHELTWDFRHLAAHPMATVLCAVVVAAAGWGCFRLASAFVARRQSLRGSADSRGK